MTSLCDRWGFFLVKVGCKAGKDEEGGGDCEDGGVTASPHFFLILYNLLSIVVCSSVDFSLLGLHHSFCLRDSGFPASGNFELHVRYSLLLSFLLPIQPKVAVRGADQQDVEVVVSSSVLQSCNHPLGESIPKQRAALASFCTFVLVGIPQRFVATPSSSFDIILQTL